MENSGGGKQWVLNEHRNLHEVHEGSRSSYTRVKSLELLFLGVLIQ